MPGCLLYLVSDSADQDWSLRPTQTQEWKQRDLGFAPQQPLTAHTLGDAQPGLVNEMLWNGPFLRSLCGCPWFFTVSKEPSLCGHAFLLLKSCSNVLHTQLGILGK